MLSVCALLAVDAGFLAGGVALSIRWVKGIRKRRLTGHWEKYGGLLGAPDRDGWRPVARYWGR